MFEIDRKQPANRSGYARWFILAVAVICTTISVTFFACDGAKTENITSVKYSISASVDWDKDQAADGVQFRIRPLDDYGLLVKDNMVVNAKIWKLLDENNSDNITLLQEWDGINITKKDFDQYGAVVRLEFTNYVPLAPDKGKLWVEAFVPDGRNFSFQESNILLGYYNILNTTVCNPSSGSSSCCPTK